MSPRPADVRDHLERLSRGHAILRDLRLVELRTLSVDELDAGTVETVPWADLRTRLYQR